VTIRTVGELRVAMADAPSEMPLRVLLAPGLLVGVEQLVWLDERCVLDLGLTPRTSEHLKIVGGTDKAVGDK
jgi:hypothetical protein